MNNFVEKTEQQQPVQSIITPPISPVQTSNKNSFNVVPGQSGLPWLAHDANAEDFTPTVTHNTTVSSEITNNIENSRRGLNQQSNSRTDVPLVSPPPKFTARPPRKASIIRLPTRKRTIQKQIYSMKDGIDPVNTLCKRLLDWQVSIKYLISLFRSIKKVETNTGKGYQKIDANFKFPTKIKNQFKSSNGVQDAWMSFRQYSRENSLIHEDFVEFIENAIIPSLHNMLKDIDQKMRSLRKNKALRTTVLYNCREKVDKIITRYNFDIHSTLNKQEKANDYYVIPKRDPLLVKYAVIHTIRNMYKQENRLHQEFLHTQDAYRQFEQQKIINVYRNVFQSFEEYRCQKHLENLEGITKAANIFNAIETDSEWMDFVHHHDNELVKQTAAFKDMNHLDFPNANHRLAQPLIAGYLQRLNGKGWSRGYYIISPVGILYRFASEDGLMELPMNPELSIFLPQSEAFIDPLTHLFKLKGKIINGLFKSRRVLQLSSTDPNHIQQWIQIIRSMVIKHEEVSMNSPNQQAANNIIDHSSYSQQNAPVKTTKSSPQQAKESNNNNYNNNSSKQTNQNQAIPTNDKNQPQNLNGLFDQNTCMYNSKHQNTPYNSKAVTAGGDTREQPHQNEALDMKPMTVPNNKEESTGNDNHLINNSSMFNHNNVSQPYNTYTEKGQNYNPQIKNLNYENTRNISSMNTSSPTTTTDYERNNNDYRYSKSSSGIRNTSLSNSGISDSSVITPTNNRSTRLGYTKVNDQQVNKLPTREGNDVFFDATNG